MPNTKVPTKRAKPKKGTAAVRRLCIALDRMIAAAEQAKRAREELERITRQDREVTR